jgi:hypothetical protein
MAGPLMQDDAGNVFEVDAQGRPIRLVSGPAASQGRIFTLPPNPKEVRAEARADEDQQMQRENAIRAERAADRADKTAQRQAAAAERTANAAAKPTEFQSKSAGFLGRMMQAEHDFNAVSEGNRDARSLPRQALHNIAPGIENTLVNTPERQKADQAVENFIAASLRQESGAAISPMEFTRQYKIFFPASGDSEETLAQKAAARRQAVEAFRIAAGPLAEQAAASVQIDKPKEVEPNKASQDNLGVATPTGGTRSQYSPRQSAMVDAMINAGASKAMIDASLKKQGFGPIRADDLSAAKRWMKDNPGKAYFGAQIYKNDDLNLGQRILANEAVAPVAAGVARAGDAASAGLLGAVAGEEGRGALEAAGALHPVAAPIGDILGSAAGVMGGEAALAARAPAALARFAPRIADALYGGMTGFNQAQEGEGLKGAALGAGAGLAGGVVGERAARGLGSVIRGVRNPAVSYLREQGVPLTVGQTLGGSGWLGNAVRGAEDRLSGFWGIGDVIKARQREGAEAVADRMAKDAVAPIGGTASGYGEPTVNDILQQGSDAYKTATAGAQVPLDPQFATDMAQLRALGGTLPDDLSQRFGKALENRIAPVEADTYLSGDTFQQAVRGLKGYRAEATKPGFEQDYRDYLSTGIDALKDQMRRGGGSDVVERLADADKAWRQIKVVQKATQAARNGARSGEIGLPMPSNFNDAATAAAQKYGGPRFNAELIDAAQRVLPNKVPDSGTAGRLGLGAMLAGGVGVGGGAGALGGDAQSGAATGLGLTLLLAAGGSKPAQRTMVNILAKRPDLATRIGDIIAHNSGIGGWTGAGVLTPLMIGSQN